LAFDPFACDNALPAADLEVAEVRPSRNTFDAAVAAFGDVVSRPLLLCVNALPAAVLDALPVFDELRVFDAAVAAFGSVFLVATVLSFPALVPIAAYAQESKVQARHQDLSPGQGRTQRRLKSGHTQQPGTIWSW